MLESGFGSDAFVARSPLSGSRITYHSVTSIRRRGDFVLLKQVGFPVVTTFPAALFPDEAVARIRAAAR